MKALKGLWSGLRNVFHPPETFETYSHKSNQWVTINVPEGQQDLIEAELQKWEESEDTACERKLEEPTVTKLRPLTGVEERNEWMRNLQGVPYFSSAKREEYIAALGSDYDSMDALLVVPMPLYNDPISPTTGSWVNAVERDGRYYWSAAEIDLVIRLGDDLPAFYFLKAIRTERDRRCSLYLVREKGYCCQFEADRQELVEWASESLCCEKAAPEAWELDWNSVEHSARIRKFRELKRNDVLE